MWYRYIGDQKISVLIVPCVRRYMCAVASVVLFIRHVMLHSLHVCGVLLKGGNGHYCIHVGHGHREKEHFQ